jgi:8-oxo-dGTP diphosphatase
MLRSAVKREVFEEVGLLLEDDLNYIVSNYFVDSFGAHVIDTIFHCKIQKTKLEISASKLEVAEYSWMTREEVDQAENGSPWMKKYFEYIDSQI